MTGSEGLIDLSLAEFARAVASRTAVPGSGSVAAAVGAFGAGLVSMALASGSGEGVSAAGQEGALTNLVDELLARVDQDAVAYRSFLSARRGKGSLAQATERSIVVPREVAELALRALQELLNGLSRVRPELHSECVTAAGALLAAVEGATFTAAANLGGVADSGQREERRRDLAVLRQRARVLAGSLHQQLHGQLDARLDA